MVNVQIPVEWNLFGNGTAWDYSTNKQVIYPFWVEGAERSRLYESLYTVGMRGDGDCTLPRTCTNRPVTILISTHQYPEPVRTFSYSKR